MILIIIIASAILAAYFATQNTQTTTITLINQTFESVPVYAIALGSLLAGIVLFWLINLIRVLSVSLSLRGKEKTIHEAKKEVAELSKEVHKLEIENTKLQSKLGEETKDENSL